MERVTAYMARRIAQEAPARPLLDDLWGRIRDAADAGGLEVRIDHVFFRMAGRDPASPVAEQVRNALRMLREDGFDCHNFDVGDTILTISW